MIKTQTEQNGISPGNVMFSTFDGAIHNYLVCKPNYQQHGIAVRGLV